MRYFKILMLLVLFSLKIQAQKREILNTPYYSQKDISDPYKESQCKLDIYLPNNNNKALPVIVWFHGGGLKGGTKAIPEELKNDKFIIVSAAYRLSPKV
ncbi:MAG: alpha/beta hydrolase, partial [Chitinophagaceae bacterium]|nr:alpha/beta hydrolase [Chitinophagaceae bacterium]